MLVGGCDRDGRVQRGERSLRSEGCEEDASGVRRMHQV